MSTDARLKGKDNSQRPTLGITLAICALLLASGAAALAVIESSTSRLQLGDLRDSVRSMERRLMQKAGLPATDTRLEGLEEGLKDTRTNMARFAALLIAAVPPKEDVEQNAESLEDMEDLVDTLEQEVDSLEHKLSRLGYDAEETESALSRVADEVSGTESDIRRLKSDVSEAELRISTCESDIIAKRCCPLGLDGRVSMLELYH